MTALRPASFPSRLRCVGQGLVDANGYRMPIQYGFNIQVVSAWSQQVMDGIAAKGATLLRTIVFWDLVEPTRMAVDQRFIDRLDTQVARAQQAGMYLLLCFYGSPQHTHIPAWLPGQPGADVANASRTGNFVRFAEFAVTYLANRYGNPASPRYTPAVIGLGLNEPTPDYSHTPDWMQHLVAQQNTIAGWVRSAAPDWIYALSFGFGHAAAIPNAPGSGQTAQTHLAVSRTPITGGNFIVDGHDYLVGNLSTDRPDFDGRSAGGPGHPGSGLPWAAPNGPQITVPNAAGYGGSYPPVVGGSQVDRSITRRQFRAWMAPYREYCGSQWANCPLLLGEVGWAPPSISTGASDFVEDKYPGWLEGKPVGILIWAYGHNQTQNQFSSRPRKGPGTQLGTDPDGWTTFVNTFMAARVPIPPKTRPPGQDPG